VSDGTFGSCMHHSRCLSDGASSPLSGFVSALDIPTFGGPAAYLSGFLAGFLQGEQVLRDRGIVVGSADTPTHDPHPALCANPDCFASHTFRWEKGALIDLGALPGLNTSGANAVNARE